MTSLEEIKAAVDAGCLVHWRPGYIVTKSAAGDYLVCDNFDYCNFLVQPDGSFNYDPLDFKVS
jgi:hypothetical protein